jgi:Na+/H+-dicarboxylate symporter
MDSARPRPRWRSGLRAARYVIVLGIVGGGALLAVGLLFFFALGLFVGSGLLGLFLGLGLVWYVHPEGERRVVPR